MRLPIKPLYLLQDTIIGSMLGRYLASALEIEYANHHFKTTGSLFILDCFAMHDSILGNAFWGRTYVERDWGGLVCGMNLEKRLKTVAYKAMDVKGYWMLDTALKQGLIRAKDLDKEVHLEGRTQVTLAKAAKWWIIPPNRVFIYKNDLEASKLFRSVPDNFHGMLEKEITKRGIYKFDSRLVDRLGEMSVDLNADRLSEGVVLTTKESTPELVELCKGLMDARIR